MKCFVLVKKIPVNFESHKLAIISCLLQDLHPFISFLLSPCLWLQMEDSSRQEEWLETFLFI